ncbi:MAG: FG-GAP-like repeat-containing protein [Acidobacteriota bacterium]
MLSKWQAWIAACAVLAAPVALASGPSFHPQFTLTGYSLQGWKTLGDATWTAGGGEVRVQPHGGGWLVLDRSIQDVNFYAEFRCASACETGVLLRAEKTPDGGMKGIYVSLTDPGIGEYEVTVDAQGKIAEKQKMRSGGGLIRVAPPPPPPGTPVRQFHFPRYNVELPLTPPNTSLRPDEWNSAEIFLDANIVRAHLNDGREVGAVGDSDGYGPVALYAGGTGEVEFKAVAVGDMGLKVRQPHRMSAEFRRQRLSDFYYGWSSSAADFNHDGYTDIVSGPYIYYGPDYRTSREIWLAAASNPTTEFASKDTMEFAGDFTGDGWPDVLTVDFGSGPSSGGILYVNPKGEGRRWKSYKVIDGVQSEIAVLRDLNGDGKPALVYMGGGYVRYAQPAPSNPTGKWTVHTVSEQGYGTAHGIGVGDVNGDGRLDIVNMYGWWEHPATGASDHPWKYHPAVFGQYHRGIVGGSVMAVYDVNGDGLNDVVTSLDAHGWGLAWFEQKRDAKGNISFVRHMIMDDFSTKNAGGVTFSELHGSTYADVNGDGIPDFIVGKRYFSHLDTNIDPDPRDAPVLYWYETVRDKNAPGGARFVPHLIDNHSGAGSDVLAVDLKHNGAMDIVTTTRFGTFIYWNQMRAQHGRAAKGK